MPTCKPHPEITLEFINSILKYDPETGIVDSLKKRVGRKPKDGLPGHVTPSGYRSINIAGTEIQLHNLIWFMQTGEWPERIVDHKDRIRLNNKWTNLRLADDSESGANKSLLSNNKSGHPGIWWHKGARKWTGEIAFRKKKRYLGLFDSLEKAVAAAKRVRKEMHGEFAAND